MTEFFRTGLKPSACEGGVKSVVNLSAARAERAGVEERYVPKGMGWYCQISQPAHAEDVWLGPRMATQQYV